MYGKRLKLAVANADLSTIVGLINLRKYKRNNPYVKKRILKIISYVISRVVHPSSFRTIVIGNDEMCARSNDLTCIHHSVP